jgi:ABC-2 type transport system permease protein
MRVLRQLRHDPRTVAMLLLVPAALMGLLAWTLDGRPGAFTHFAPEILGVFPLIVMFLVTSVTTLRERSRGTLERLLTLPLMKVEFILGYAVAFAVVAVAQSLIASGLTFSVFGAVHSGFPWRIVAIAICAALLGSSLGLALSAIANSEFQAVQFMPAFLLPQLLLCGIVVPVDELPTLLHSVANVLPMTAAVRATTTIESTSQFAAQVAIMLAYVVGALFVGSTTLRRRTA